MALYGAAMALIENHMRKLFSYHIVSQLGYMVAALALGSEMGIDGSAAHAFQNILYKGTLFMCTGAVVYATGKEKISQLGGLRKDMPVTSLCFLTASLAIAGFPLLNGFVSKGLIMNSMAESGAALAELLLMIASIGTFLSITLKVNYFVFFGAAETITEADEGKVPVNMKVAMVIGALACVFFGLFPQAIYHLVPYGTDGHAYTMDHITQSLELFAGAGLVFVMMIEHMKPKEKITLDTDWFYRKPMKALILGLSIGISMLFQIFHSGHFI